jgi:hypothetical protein
VYQQFHVSQKTIQVQTLGRLMAICRLPLDKKLTPVSQSLQIFVEFLPKIPCKDNPIEFDDEGLIT